MTVQAAIEPFAQPYWDALRGGELSIQRCRECSNAWLPARQECPRCLADAPEWEVACGGARLVSWVVYRRAMHPDFADRVPYNVAIVELDEGARLISNIDAPESDLRIDARLTFVAVERGGTAVTSFVLA